jgi:glutathione synthase/RimK-type ligase-like ATP-grasp enzyme
VAVDGPAHPVPLRVAPSEPIRRAAREPSRVALVTCGELPDLDPDDRLLLAPLAAAGIAAEAAVWDDPHVDWAGYDLAVLRSTWDYPPRRDEFVAWARRVPALANPADVVAWNTDKRYLGELAAAGVPVVPTTYVEPGAGWFAYGTELVVKPTVGAGSLGAGRYKVRDAEEGRLFDEHLSRLLAAGRTAMLQPYLRGVDTAGETSLLYLAGPGGLAFSHAARKGPMLTGPEEAVAGLFKEETITPREPSAEELAVGERALAAVPGGSGRLLYARVDVVPDDDGRTVLLELELTEPSLFLGQAAGAAHRFADAIAARARHGTGAHPPG